MWPLGVPAVAWQAPSGHVVPYTHDSVSRLRTVTYPDATWSSYTYDPMGNRTELGTQAGTTTYGYDRSDRLLSTAGLSSLSFTYDGRGNETAKGSSTFGYDSANRLTSANTGGTASTYAYNGEGVRIGKTVGGVSTSYLQDVVGGLPHVLVESTGGAQTLYVYGNGLAWQVNADGTHRYYHADSLGSTRVVTDDAGNVASTYSYYAYGRPRARTGETRSFTYTGEQTDPESSLEFLRARSYDPQTGRFLQRDVLRVGNRYGYANANPMRYVDPSGADGWDVIQGIADAIYGFGEASSDAVTFNGSAAMRLASAKGSPDSEAYWFGRVAGDSLMEAAGAAAAIAAPLEAGGGIVTGPGEAAIAPAAAAQFAWASGTLTTAETNRRNDLSTFFSKRSSAGAQPHCGGPTPKLETAGSVRGTTGLKTKASAREVVDILGLPGEQAAEAKSAIGRATASSSIDILEVNGQVIVRVNRPGFNGHQSVQSTIGPDGTKSVVQIGYDAEGTLTHFDPKTP